jgi:hypothetical protein
VSFLDIRVYLQGLPDSSSRRRNSPSTSTRIAHRCSFPRLLVSCSLYHHELSTNVCPIKELWRCSTKGEVISGRHFLEGVDDTPPRSKCPIRPFIFTNKRLKTPLQIHSIEFEPPRCPTRSRWRCKRSKNSVWKKKQKKA